MRLSQLCRLGGMDLIRDAEVSSLGLITHELPGRLVLAASESYAELANEAPDIAAVLVSPELARLNWNDRLGIAAASDPGRAFVDLHNHLVSKTDFYGPVGRTSIDPTARIHLSAHIDSHGVVVGPRCRIAPGAIVLEGSDLGCQVHVMSGAVVAGIGFQTRVFGSDVVDFEHAGGVRIGDRTIVMANAVIARAVFKQATQIGADCRIGNGAFVSHNSRIGPRSLIGHGATIVGDVEIGADVVVGPGAICLNRISVGDGARITAGAVLTQHVASGGHVSGNFAVDHAAFIRALKRNRSE